MFLADGLGIIGLVVGREREGVDYFRGLLREIDKMEFSFRGIESKIVRRHPRRDESNSGLKADETFLGTKGMKSCVSSAYRR